MNEEKKVYESISELTGNPAPQSPMNVRSEDLQIIQDLNQIAPATQKDDRMQTDDSGFWASLDAELDASIADTDRMLKEAIQEKQLQAAEDEDSKYLDGESTDSYDPFSEPNPNGATASSVYDSYTPTKVYKTTDTSSNGLFDDEEEDFTDNDLEEKPVEINTDVEEEEKEILKSIQSTIKSQIKPINNPVDISTFKFSKKHLSANKAMQVAETKERTVDWVLLKTGKKITLREFKGYEIDQLSTDNLNGRTVFRMYQDIYKLIYSHIVDDNKVPFEAWLKSIRNADINDLYFAIYKACFVGANTIPYSCNGKDCKNIYMKDVPMEDMVKYKDDSVKKKVEEILNGTSTIDGTEEIDVMMISDNYAVGLKNPSIYNVYFELSILDEEFRDKFSAFLGFMSYIDEIYFVNRETQELIPIDVSIDDHTNLAKQIKNKILQYSKILRTLSPDQFGALQSYIYNIEQENNEIEYRIPESTCPKCNTKIPEQITTPEQMIFLRRQLLLIANSSIN